MKENSNDRVGFTTNLNARATTSFPMVLPTLKAKKVQLVTIPCMENLQIIL